MKKGDDLKQDDKLQMWNVFWSSRQQGLVEFDVVWKERQETRKTVKFLD